MGVARVFSAAKQADRVAHRVRFERHPTPFVVTNLPAPNVVGTELVAEAKPRGEPQEELIPIGNIWTPPPFDEPVQGHGSSVIGGREKFG